MLYFLQSHFASTGRRTLRHLAMHIEMYATVHMCIQPPLCLSLCVFSSLPLPSSMSVLPYSPSSSPSVLLPTVLLLSSGQAKRTVRKATRRSKSGAQRVTPKTGKTRVTAAGKSCVTSPVRGTASRAVSAANAPNVAAVARLSKGSGAARIARLNARSLLDTLRAVAEPAPAGEEEELELVPEAVAVVAARSSARSCHAAISQSEVPSVGRSIGHERECKCVKEVRRREGWGN